VAWPSPRQLLSQVGIVLLIGVLWGALFAGYARLNSEQAGAPPGREPETAAALVTPTEIAATENPEMPTPTAVVTASDESVTPASLTYTPTPPTSDTRPVTSPTEMPEPSGDEEMASPESEPSPIPTDTLVPSPVPTEALPTATDTPAPVEETAAVSFAADVLPILERRCVKCHGGERTEEGLILKVYADVMAGSWNGPVVEPGSAADSYLAEQIISGKMPKKEPRLLPSEIRIISDWIDAGASDN
jgi:hypothetical protein